MPDNGNLYQSVPNSTTPPPISPESDLFRRGREVLGLSGGGLIAKLKKYKQGNIALARAILEVASTKHSPREYIGRILSGMAQEDGEPAVVRDGRRDGLFVERMGADRWKVGTWIYDGAGREIGF